MSDSLGISVQIYQPLIQGTRAIGGALNDALTSYSHEINIFGGYDQARLTFTGQRSTIEDWIEQGLGRRIVTYDDAGIPIWEGFVNRLTARLGGLEMSLGPVLGLTNYARLVYSAFLTGGQGIRLTTAWASHAASVAKYGRLETVLSSGGIADSEATQIRDMYLAENALAETSREQSYSNSSNGLSINLECLGYNHWLETYTYNSATAGTINRSALVAAVLAASPNAFFSTDQSRISTNTSQVQATWDKDDTAQAVIKHVVAGGDASLQRWSFGIYADRKAVYEPVSQTIDYLQHLGSPGGEVTNTEQQTIKPWNILPGKWLFFPDFLVGRINTDTALASDPRALFIESVAYTVPWGLSVNGSKVSKLSQKLARLGLSGIGG